LLALGVVVGLVAGRFRRPAGLHTVRPHVEQIPLLVVGAALNAASVLLDGAPATGALVASLAVLIAVAVANRHITGVAVIGVGLLVNLVGVAVNAGLPVRPSALEAAGVSVGSNAELSGARHLETADDALPVLGDVLPVPFAHEVMSFGDLIIVIGAADAVRDLTRRRARRDVQVPVPAEEAYWGWTTTASVDQLWGDAPSGSPVAASQYSENLDLTAPVTIDLAKAEAVVREFTELMAANQSR
jgi:hypothetical protein